MYYWNYIVIGLSLLVLVFVLAKEILRANKARCTARIIAVLLAVASLACIALPVSFSRNSTGGNNAEAILLTAGYNADSLQAFQKKSAGIKVYTLQEYMAAVPVADVLHVFGFGLTAAQWQQLPRCTIIPHVSPIPGGIIAADWQRKMVTGEKLYLQGIYNNTAGKPVRIILAGFGTALDSLSVTAEQQVSFTLQTIPRHQGVGVYSLVVMQGKDTVQQQPVPVEVLPARTLNVLFLASSPGFDNRFLANWLAQHGYAVAMRSSISRDKYDHTFFNTPRITLDKLSTVLLDKYDVVLSDATALQALSGNELSALRQQIEQKGLGLVVKADTLLNRNAFYGYHFPLITSKDSTHQSVALLLPGSTLETAPLSVEQPVYINYDNGTQPLIKDKQAKIYASCVLQGSGKLVVTTLTQTYSWPLAGNQADYERYWSILLQKAARKPVAKTIWRTSPVFGYVHEPVKLYLETPVADPPQIIVEGVPVAPARNGFEWQVSYWPQHAGWQTALDNAGDTCRWYIFPAGSWQQVRALGTLHETRQLAEMQSYHDHLIQDVIKPVSTPVPVSKAWFFMLFLLACTFLWVERKM